MEKLTVKDFCHLIYKTLQNQYLTFPTYLYKIHILSLLRHCPIGEIGKHSRLKICRQFFGLPVRVWHRAPKFYATVDPTVA